MNTADAKPTFPNPLRDIHAQAGAEFLNYDALEIVSTFGDVRNEYQSVQSGMAMLDQPHRGILELRGRDRLSFLNNLVTNLTWDKTAKSGIPAGSGVYAFFLNIKGRIIADMNVLECGDVTLIETDVRLVEPLREVFDKYLFSEEATLRGKMGELHQIALHGPNSATMLEQAGADVRQLAPLASMTGRVIGFEARIWRDDVCGVPGFHLVLEPAAARHVWMNFSAQNARPIGWAAFNTARVEAGRPMFGIDFEGVAVQTAYPAKKQREAEAAEESGPGVLPAETGMLNRAVSFTKGCYLGQEIVARMYARNQVPRQTAGIRFADDALPLAGAGVFDSQSNQVGIITSSTISPRLNGVAIALAFLKKPHFTPGTVLTVPAEGSMRAGTVVALPFAS